MKVKANWLVDADGKEHQAGDKFDLPDDQAEQLEKLGAIEILSRKKAAAKAGEAAAGDGEPGDGGEGAGADNGDPQS
ncbi:hypothetical protein KB879_06230 [Cupriavidus sp. KK10]|jgi:hypothetical protein|uniref:DUF7210 family protein n=1 Tax=Cupriavidus sp. KK10 TaxID=1478019 RepID=UPI001BAB413A|nr:hypothetical protein [Cupriavidus sp. KK10]QUN29542.1 hypothetical protein KB879_06230 [Cupriavidus sp. KK10]